VPQSFASSENQVDISDLRKGVYPVRRLSNALKKRASKASIGENYRLNRSHIGNFKVTL
jgi:hypothetical protein